MSACFKTVNEIFRYRLLFTTHKCPVFSLEPPVSIIHHSSPWFYFAARRCCRCCVRLNSPWRLPWRPLLSTIPTVSDFRCFLPYSGFPPRSYYCSTVKKSLCPQLTDMTFHSAYTRGLPGNEQRWDCSACTRRGPLVRLHPSYLIR